MTELDVSEKCIWKSMLSSMWKLSKEHFVQRVHMEDKWIR